MNNQEQIRQLPESDEIRMNLLGVNSSVVFARELVRYALTKWGYSRPLIDESILVMSEITTNAANAAPGHTLRIRVAVHNGAPLLECWDPAPEVPLATALDLDALSGRGMAIVAAYAKDTGVRPSATGVGKIVWALMPT